MQKILNHCVIVTASFPGYTLV